MAAVLHKATLALGCIALDRRTLGWAGSIVLSLVTTLMSTHHTTTQLQ